MRSPTSQTASSSTASRLFYSVSDGLYENDDNPRSVYSPRRNWGSSLPVRQARKDLADHQMQEYNDGDEDLDEVDSDVDEGRIAGRTSPHNFADASHHNILESRRNGLYSKLVQHHMSSSKAPVDKRDYTNDSVYAGDNRIIREQDAPEEMANTYTGHLYTDSVIRSSWRPYDDEDESSSMYPPRSAFPEQEGDEVGAKEENHEKQRKEQESDGSTTEDIEHSRLSSLRNSLESVGLESVMKTRRDSPPPPRLRFHEHPFPRNMTAATMNTVALQRQLIDHNDRFSRKNTEISHFDAGLSDHISIEMPTLVDRYNRDDIVDGLNKLVGNDAEGQVVAHGRVFSNNVTDRCEQLVAVGYVPPMVTHTPINEKMHDALWSRLYILSMCCLFATSFIIWLRTEVTHLISVADTVYTVIGGSTGILVTDTFVAIAISMAWFILLKTFIRPLLYLLIISIPVALTSLTMYPLIMSYRDSYGGETTQDKAMRWTSLIPIILAVLWIWFSYRGRRVLGRGIGMIHLACKILRDNPCLLVLSVGTLVSFVTFTWIWVGMFTRVFLRGRASADSNGMEKCAFFSVLLKFC